MSPPFELSGLRFFGFGGEGEIRTPEAYRPPDVVCPLRRCETRTVPSCGSSPGRSAPLLELATLQSVVSVEVSGLLSYPAPVIASSFPTDRYGLSATPAPASRKKPGSSSRGLRSPPEFVLFSPAPTRAGAPPVGSRPSSRHQHSESTNPIGIPGRPSFRPRRFTRPRRFPPPTALRACFIPLPCPGFALQGFPPPSQP